MSNTIRLTSVYGEVRWAKSLNYDGDRIARRTETIWVAQDIDWPDRDDYPRWFLPPGREVPETEWVGGIVREPDGEIRFPGPMSDEKVAAVIEAGATMFTELRSRAYDDEGATINSQHIDWTKVRKAGEVDKQQLGR